MRSGTQRAWGTKRREPILRPHSEVPASFVCPACDVVLWDGTVYTWCPACNLPVDWVDLTISVWCCPRCDRMVNENREEPPACERCARPLNRIHALERPPSAESEAPGGQGRLRELASRVLGFPLVALLGVGLLSPVLSLALDPSWRLQALALGTPLLVLPLTVGGAFLWSVGTSLRELRDLARDQRTRVIHGLEHATANLLLQGQHRVLGGLTYRSFFELHLANEGPAAKQAAAVRRAANDAIRRVRRGERHLAYSPRCGTSLMVMVMLLALMAVVASAVGLWMDLRPEGLAVLGATFLTILLVGSKPLGLLAQRLLTVSTSFRSARLLRVVRTLSPNARRATYDIYFQLRG